MHIIPEDDGVLRESLKLFTPPIVLTGKETHPYRWTNPSGKIKPLPVGFLQLLNVPSNKRE